jgi:hypothetical protein
MAALTTLAALAAVAASGYSAYESGKSKAPAAPSAPVVPPPLPAVPDGAAVGAAVTPLRRKPTMPAPEATSLTGPQGLAPAATSQKTLLGL